MARYGGVLQSEQWFDRKAPEWNYDKNSWWVGGRVGIAEPFCRAPGRATNRAGLEDLCRHLHPVAPLNIGGCHVVPVMLPCKGRVHIAAHHP